MFVVVSAYNDHVGMISRLDVINIEYRSLM